MLMISFDFNLLQEMDKTIRLKIKETMYSDMYQIIHDILFVKLLHSS